MTIFSSCYKILNYNFFLTQEPFLDRPLWIMSTNLASHTIIFYSLPGNTFINKEKGYKRREGTNYRVDNLIPVPLSVGHGKILCGI